METEQWLALLSEKALISYENTRILQQNLTNLITNKLVKGDEFIFPPLGKLGKQLRNAFLAVLPNGEIYIIPPRVELTLTASNNTNWGELGDAFVESSKLTLNNTKAFLQAFTSLTHEVIEKEESITWKGLGTIVPTTDAQLAYSFLPSNQLLDTINQAFAFYEPTLLAEGKNFPQLEEKHFSSLDEALKPLVLAPTENNIVSPNIPDISQNKLANTSTLEKQADTNANITENSPMSPFSPSAEGTNQQHCKTVQNTPVQTLNSPTINPIMAHNQFTPPPFPPQFPTKEKKVSTNDSSQHFASPLKEIPSYTNQSTKQKKASRYSAVNTVLLSIAIFLLLVLIGLWVYGRLNPTESTVKQVINTENTQTKQTETSSAPTTQPAENSLNQKQAIESTTQPQQPLGKVTIERGATLASIAKEHYGNKVFWVYIYEENKSIIKNPNNVPLGTELTLPNPSKYNIDSNSKESIDKAKKLEHKILTVYPY